MSGERVGCKSQGIALLADATMEVVDDRVMKCMNRYGYRENKPKNARAATAQ